MILFCFKSFLVTAGRLNVSEDVGVPEDAYACCDTVDNISEDIASDLLNVSRDVGVPEDADACSDTDVDVFVEVITPSTSQSHRKHRTTSDEDRERVITAYENGYTATMIADMLSINRSTVYSILKKFWKTGEVEAKKRGGIKPKKLTSAAISDIQKWIDEDCSISLKKLGEKILESHGIQVSAATIAREIKKFNYSFKRVKLLPERRNNPNTLGIRKEYALSFNRISQRLPQAAVVFIDEVGFNISMRTSMGRSLVGTAATKVVPQIRTRNVSIVCAMNRGGILHYISKKRAINQGVFAEFVKELNTNMNGHNVGHQPILIMDNVAFHKCTTVRETIVAEGFDVMYLPPYSPFLNPIENLFSKWKNIVRRANPQNETELMTAIEQAASLITAEDCDGYFCNMFHYIERCILGEEIND